MPLNIIAYTDIHHDDYQNGLTLDDTISVEDDITKDAQEQQVECVINVGDWFRATNPSQLVAMAAEGALKRRCDAGIPTWELVGNHDRFTKSALSGHAFGRVAIFKSDLGRVMVFDKIAQVFNRNHDVSVLAVPSGHDLKTMGPMDRSAPVIVLFHGVITSEFV